MEMGFKTLKIRMPAHFEKYEFEIKEYQLVVIEQCIDELDTVARLQINILKYIDFPMRLKKILKNYDYLLDVRA